MNEADFGRVPPSFKPDAALIQLKRQLRDLKLTERGHGFERRGKRVAELQIEGVTIAARMARKLAITPEWDKLTMASASDQRKWLDELSKRLARWDREE